MFLHIVNRAARVAFSFVLMNYAAVAGLVCLCRGDAVWTPDVSSGPEVARTRVAIPEVHPIIIVDNEHRQELMPMADSLPHRF
jgi:hypothetical protein